MPGAFWPALLKSTSSRPNFSFVRANSARTESGLVTSVGTASARAPSAPAAFTVPVERVRAPPGERDRVAVLQQRERDRLADAAAGAGDDGDLALRAH